MHYIKCSLLISVLALCSCTRIAHIDNNGNVVIDRPDLYSETARLHEVEGHLWGLQHCNSKKCYMYFMDVGSVILCSKCKAKLRTTTSEWLFNR